MEMRGVLVEWRPISGPDTRHKSAPVAHERLDQCFLKTANLETQRTQRKKSAQRSIGSIKD